MSTAPTLQGALPAATRPNWRGPGSRSLSAIWRHALTARPVIWLIAVVVSPVGPPPVVAPLDVSGTATRSGCGCLIHGAAYYRTGNEGRRREPEAIVLPVAGTTVPVAPVATPIGAVAAALEAISAPIPTIAATVVPVAPILHIRHIGRYRRSLRHENRRSGSGYRRTNCK